MIVYSNSIKNFCNEINDISTILNKRLKSTIHKFSNKSEIDSWSKSLKYFSEILIGNTLDDTITITLEYNIPLTSNRIDLILSGYNEFREPILLIFELKQWSKVNILSDSEYLVETFLNSNVQKVVHPGYQVWSYSEILKDYNKYIQDNKIKIYPCLLMHNYKISKDEMLLDKKFSYFMKNVHFFDSKKEKLVEYLKNTIFFGDNGLIIKNIDNSLIQPSFKLQNDIDKLIKENSFFNLIDQQVLVFDKILSILEYKKNNVIIVEGKPGTGKSILAINLLNKLINKGKTCNYVTRNTAPRVVYSYKLKGTMKKTNIDFLFKSSGSYTDIIERNIDTLIIDEAQCLTEKSGLFNNYGENQIIELIKSSNNSVFFIDELQKVHLNDIGTIDNIKKIANSLNYNVISLRLDCQFRCNGSNAYLSFIDYLLGYDIELKEKYVDYDFKIIDNPNQLFNIIKEKNGINSSRLLAGYCWNWNKKEANNTNYHDIIIDNFEISWNLGQNQTYAIDDSINEAGCIHSVQGLEFDYVGVIIGKDLIYRNGKVLADYESHGSADPSFKGIKKMFKKDFGLAQQEAEILIKNAYRVLLTRGSKGCYIYVQDIELRNYVKSILNGLKFNS